MDGAECLVEDGQLWGTSARHATSFFTSRGHKRVSEAVFQSDVTSRKLARGRHPPVTHG